ncbi:MAG: HAMP domain-containing sensor histidine kinase [Saprospiraceae bacterium]
MEIKGNKKQILANGLMVSSLFFLACFLSLYLYKSYQKEYANLQREVGYYFVSSIRKIEGGVLNKLIFQSDSMIQPQFHTKHFRRDSKTLKSIIKIEDHNIEMQGRKLEVRVDRTEKELDLNQIEGSVTMFIAVGNDSLELRDSCVPVSESTRDFLSALEASFKSNMQIAKLPISYSITKEGVDTLINRKMTLMASYTDVTNGDRYVVNIENYSLYLIRMILPEVLFSILLFLSLLISFYLVYKSLASESMLLNLKNDFIQNITHELKTPVATVSVALEALQDFNVLEDSIKRTDYINISKQELKRLSLLIDRVLNISQVGKKMPTIYATKLELNKVVLDILVALKLQFEKYRFDINFECIGDDFIIFGDKQQIESLVFNLLDNALKYGNKDQPKIQIQIKQQEKFVCLIVSDNGIGIPKEYQDHIFEKFYRVPQGEIHNVKGYGLGLSYVAAVVREMGGKIQVESTQNVGTSFIIQFPMRQAD